MDNDFPQILKKMKPLISLIPYNIITMYNPVIMRNIMLLYRIPHSVRPNFFYISLYINKIYRQLFYFKVTHLSRSLSFPLFAFLAILILFPPRWISQVLWYSFFFLVYILSILFPLISRFCDFSVDFSRCFVLMRFCRFRDFALFKCDSLSILRFCLL